MQVDSGHRLDVIRADGGLVANTFMCQFLADMLDISIEIPHVTEATAWGAAALAGVQVGVFCGIEDIAGGWKADKNYRPQMEPEQRERLYDGWKSAMKMLLGDTKGK